MGKCISHNNEFDCRKYFFVGGRGARGRLPHRVRPGRPRPEVAPGGGGGRGRTRRGGVGEF